MVGGIAGEQLRTIALRWGSNWGQLLYSGVEMSGVSTAVTGNW